MKLRIEKDMTQEQFAKLLNLSTGQQVSDWERGKIEVSDKKIKIVAKIFGKEVAKKIIRNKIKRYQTELENNIKG